MNVLFYGLLMSGGKIMFETLRKSSFKSSLILSAILLIGGGALALFNASNAFFATTSYADFTTLAPDEIKSQLVDIELWENFGCFMESGSKNTSTNKVTISNYYYIIYTGAMGDADTEYKYMAIKVPASYGSKMDIMAESTWNGLVSNPLTFSGKIRKLDDKEYKYYLEFWKEAGLTDAEIEEMTLPYYIDVSGSKLGQNIFYILLFSGGVALIVWGIFRIVKGSKGGYLKALRHDIELSGYSETYVESDFNTATSYAKNGQIRIGRLFTYYDVNSTQPRAIPNKKIIWAYQSTTTHRTNGIKTGTTYSVVIFADDYKAAFNIGVANESVAQEMLQRLNLSCPWVVVGYSDDLNALFRKNRTQFLDLRYNKVEHEAVDPAVTTEFN